MVAKGKKIRMKKIKLDIQFESPYKSNYILTPDGVQDEKLDIDILKCRAGRHVLKKSLGGHVVFAIVFIRLAKNFMKGGCTICQKVQ
jgi:hypothetical protein